MPRKSIAIFAAVCLGLAVLIGAVTLWQYQQRTETASAGAGQPVVSFGRADIGGPFQLTDQTGQAVDQSILQGHWTAVFFGFTHCPDFCPSTLQALAAARDQMGERADDLQIVFISIDPERDTPDAMADYLQTASFPTGVIGLTGTPDQIRQVAQAYRVVYSRRDLDGGGYTMDHSLNIYLMNPAGEFAIPLSASLGPDRLANLITAQMNQDG
ncbi:MAG: SCO family protein [Caulobacterales bacterium]|nr:SCO family protein [Caulobacterales bacterium]